MKLWELEMKLDAYRFDHDPEARQVILDTFEKIMSFNEQLYQALKMCRPSEPEIKARRRLALAAIDADKAEQAAKESPQIQLM